MFLQLILQSVDTQTIPPPRANYGATVLQCIIFDYYQEDYAKKQREKEEEKPKRVIINYFLLHVMLHYFLVFCCACERIFKTDPIEVEFIHNIYSKIQIFPVYNITNVILKMCCFLMFPRISLIIVKPFYLFFWFLQRFIIERF